MLEASYIRASDGIEIYLCKWLSASEQVKGVVQLTHGMVEHIGRYDEFAQFLTTQGFHVIGHDHRGHGRTAMRNGIQGYLDKRDGFHRLVHDVKDINEAIRKKYDLPVYLFGHSMGSFIARRFIQMFPNAVDGTILSGTGGPNWILGEVGKLIANSANLLCSPLAPGIFLSKVTFGQYNKRFDPCKTELDWLSRDGTEVEKYLEDPLCGFTCTNKFYQDLCIGLSFIHKKSEVKKVSPNMPIFLISGALDPVGNQGKGVFAVAKQLAKAGVKDVEVRLYDEGRHEMLKELNRQLVFNDVLSKLNNWAGRLDKGIKNNISLFQSRGS